MIESLFVFEIINKNISINFFEESIKPFDRIKILNIMQENYVFFCFRNELNDHLNNFYNGCLNIDKKLLMLETDTNSINSEIIKYFYSIGIVLSCPDTNGIEDAFSDWVKYNLLPNKIKIHNKLKLLIQDSNIEKVFAVEDVDKELNYLKNKINIYNSVIEISVEYNCMLSFTITSRFFVHNIENKFEFKNEKDQFLFLAKSICAIYSNYTTFYKNKNV
ncbi:hypothetical protein [Cysteiniphilum marinum]|uniref:hypothetical protein n=1 Tax=Cysteiniphilum marinum TaxID=2774191 RepID=UPI00193B3A3F|nr:hypothetical protein [Cysteiniphilum marinum]